MTPRQLAVIERARHTPARFVEIPPKRGVRVGDAMRKLREEDARRMSAVLGAELERLVETWGVTNELGGKESPTASITDEAGFRDGARYIAFGVSAACLIVLFL